MSLLSKFQTSFVVLGSWLSEALVLRQFRDFCAVSDPPPSAAPFTYGLSLRGDTLKLEGRDRQTVPGKPVADNEL